MFGAPIPPAIGNTLIAAILAARIILTAGGAVILGELTAGLTPTPWPPAVFALTAATFSFLGWWASGRIVPAPKE